jgi:ketosteroid isomerase-like protein
VELHYRALDAMNRRDLGAFLALMDDDVAAVPRIVAMEGGLQGHDGIRSWWANWFDVFPDYDINVLEVRDLGDVTVAALRALGHAAASNLPFEDTIWQASRWRRGKVTWWRTFSNLDEALEAAGLPEHDAHAGS